MPRVDERDGDRLAALRGLCLLDATSDPNLDAVCRIASHTFGVPIAAVTLIGARAARLKARIGLDARVLARDATICDHAIACGSQSAFIVRDLRADPRFRDHPATLGDPQARFYAGVPIALGNGSHIGTLCIVDTRARPDFSDAEARVLEDLALVVQVHLRLYEARAAGIAEAEARKQAEARLRAQSQILAEREARLAEAGKIQRAAEEATQVGHWRIDAATRSVFWSAGIARIFGRNLAEHAVGIADHVAFYHPEDRAKVARCIEAGLANDAGTGDIPYEHRSRLIRPDGETRIVKVRGAVQRDAEGRVEATVGICIDVTEAAHAEAQARETTVLLRATLENIDQGLVMVRADGRICVHNRRLAELLDLPDAVLSGEPTFADLRRHQFARGEFAGVDPALGATLAGLAIEGEPPAYTYTRPDGRILEVATMPLDAGGAVQTCTDVTERTRAEQLIAESEERHRVFAESLPQMVWTRRYADGEASYTNEQFRTFYGPIGSSAEARIARYHPEDAASILAAWDEARAGASSAKVLGRLMRHDGVYRWHKIVVTALKRDGGFAEWLATALDIDDLMSARQELEGKTQLLDLAQNAAGAGLWQWDMADDTFWVSRAGAGLLGLPMDGDDATGITLPLDVAHTAIMMSDVGDLDGEVRRGIETRAPVALQFRVRAGADRYRWIQSFGQVVYDPLTHLPVRMVGLHLDITEQKETARRIEHDAKHDALTDLPNRSLFRATLDDSLARVRTEGGSLAVMCLDLDRFKRVNDTLGHPMGDALLAEVAARLAANLRPQDVVARLGGDEFAIIHSGGRDTAEAVAERLIEIVGQPYRIEGHALSIGLSIGIALAPEHGVDPDDLFKNADLALYGAKAEGRNTFRVFTQAMNEVARARQGLETDLRDSFGRGEFRVHYQPVLSTRTGEIVSFEALIRWNHPVRGWVSPGIFIPFAEEIGFILPLGDWVLRAACQEAASWPSQARLAVNVSAIQVRHGRLVETVIQALATSGLPARRLEIEITETALMQDSAMVLETLHILRGLGVTIALDDFGTGYSSLSYLRIFPFDRIKIDRSFVATIHAPQTAEIVRAIVGLSVSLGMEITAEGVETPEQLEAVSRQGCTEVQGFLFSPAVPAERIADLDLRPARAA